MVIHWAYMKITTIILISFLTLSFSGCAKKNEKPVVTIQKFSLQKVQMNEVLNKLFSEKNVKVMYMMADGLESTRAVDCSPIGEECNYYYELINKIVNLTRDGELNENDRLILKELHQKFINEVKSSEAKLQLQWKEYINLKSESP